MTNDTVHLVEASRQGDREAFGELVKRHQNSVCAVAYSLTGSREHSEDLAQDAFWIAWQKLDTLQQPESLPAWLCGIARNLARESLRKQSRAGTVPLDSVAEPQDHADELLAQSELQSQRSDLVWSTLQTLPELYREPMVLFYRNGQSVKEVADALDLTEDCIKQRLSRGRKLLKAEVSDLIEGVLTDGLPGSAFTAGVIAGLGTLGATQAASASTVGGVAASVTKTAAMTGMIQLFGVLLGPVVGMTGGFFGMWSSIYYAPTLRTRRFALRGTALVYGFLWLFLGCLAIATQTTWTSPQTRSLLVVLCWAVYIPTLLFMIVYGNVKWRRLAQEDLGRRPAPKTPLEESPLGYRQIRRLHGPAVFIGIVGSVPFALVLFTGLSRLSDAQWIVYALPVALIAICHLAFSRMFQRGLAISVDQRAYDAMPSPVPDILDLKFHEMSKSKDPGVTRGRYWNDVFSFLGSYVGCATLFVINYVKLGKPWAACGVVLFAILAVIVMHSWLGVVRKRNLALGIAFIATGLFLSVQTRAAQVEYVHSVPVSAALIFGLYGFIGSLLLVQLRWIEDEA